MKGTGFSKVVYCSIDVWKIALYKFMYIIIIIVVIVVNLIIEIIKSGIVLMEFNTDLLCSMEAAQRLLMGSNNEVLYPG